MNDRLGEFAQVRELRKQLTNASGGRSAKTVADYKTKFEYMKRTGFRPEHAACRQTFYAYRAALVWGALEAIRIALLARDKANYPSNEWRAAMDVLNASAAVLNAYPPDPNRTHHEQTSPNFKWSDVPRSAGIKYRSKSKKHVLSYLNQIPQWRKKMYDQISPLYRDALAVCAVSGARPCEISKGVEIWRSDDVLMMRIQGAKITGNSGQPERILALSVTSAETRHLFDLAKDGKYVVKTKPQAFCAAVERAGAKVFPNIKHRISPYAYRHCLGSTLKREGICESEIAACLGHASSKSQSVYGRFIHGDKNGSGLLSARASRHVRCNHRDFDPATSPPVFIAMRPPFG